MKLGNLKIGTRLIIGFVLVILLTLSVGSVALRQMNVLTRIVNNMFDHPTAVGYAVLDIRAEINQMNEQVRRFLFASDAAELDEVERNINDLEPRLLENFQLVRERYLGGKNGVLAAEGAFSDWKSKLDQEFFCQDLARRLRHGRGSLFPGHRQFHRRQARGLYPRPIGNRRRRKLPYLSSRTQMRRVGP